MSKLYSLLAMTTATVFLVSCGGGGGGSTSQPAPVLPPSNSAPTVSNTEFQLVDGGTVSFTLSGADTDGTIANCTILTEPDQGVLTGSSPDFSYTNEGFVGTTSLTYNCTDNDGAISNTGTVTIIISPSPTGSSASGFFIDSAVRGLRYVSGDITGVTDEAGRYDLGDGNVQFFVGDLFIGEAVGEAFITPISLGAGLTASDAAGNIAQFLQSLDEDQFAENGIFISDETIAAYTDSALEIDFDVDVEQFQMASDVSAALNALPVTKVLLPRDETDEHLSSSVAVLPSEPIGSNLLASTYFGGRSREVYENSILSSPETNEFNYISGTVILFESNPADLPIPGSDTYSIGENDEQDRFIVAMNSNLTEIIGSKISRTLSLDIVYSEGVVLRSNVLDETRGLVSGIQVFSKDLSEEIVNIEDVCAPFDINRGSEVEPNRAYLVNTFSVGSSLSVMCMVEEEGINFGINNNGIESLGIRTFDSEFQESARFNVELPTLDGVEISLINEVRTDADGNIYIINMAFEEGTEGTDGRDTLVGDSTIIFSKHNSDGDLLSSIVFFRNEDERAREEITNLKISPDGSVVIAGTLFFGDSSQNNEGVDAGFPTPSEGAIKSEYDNIRDGFVAIYDADLNGLERFTFVGGDDFVDGIQKMDIDAEGNIHVAGLTLSNDIPVTDDAIQMTVGGNDSYYMKINSTLDEILYSTYFGTFQTMILDLSVAADGSVFVTGPTTDQDLPLTGGETFDDVLEIPFDTGTFNADLFISRIWPNPITP